MSIAISQIHFPNTNMISDSSSLAVLSKYFPPDKAAVSSSALKAAIKSFLREIMLAERLSERVYRD